MRITGEDVCKLLLRMCITFFQVRTDAHSWHKVCMYDPNNMLLKSTPYNGSRLNRTATSGLEGRVPQLQKAFHAASKSLSFSFVLDTFQAISVIFFNSTNTRSQGTRSRTSDLWMCRCMSKVCDFYM